MPKVPRQKNTLPSPYGTPTTPTPRGIKHVYYVSGHGTCFLNKLRRTSSGEFRKQAKTHDEITATVPANVYVLTLSPLGFSTTTYDEMQPEEIMVNQLMKLKRPSGNNREANNARRVYAPKARYTNFDVFIDKTLQVGQSGYLRDVGIHHMDLTRGSRPGTNIREVDIDELSRTNTNHTLISSASELVKQLAQRHQEEGHRILVMFDTCRVIDSDTLQRVSGPKSQTYGRVYKRYNSKVMGLVSDPTAGSAVDWSRMKCNLRGSQEEQELCRRLQGNAVREFTSTRVALNALKNEMREVEVNTTRMQRMLNRFAEQSELNNMLTNALA